MANKRLQLLKINSVDVSAYVLNWRLPKNFGDPIDELVIDLVRNVTDVVTFAAGQTVELWFGYTTSTDKKHFNGELIKYEPEGGLISVLAYNSLYATVRKTISAKIYDKDVVGDPIYPDGKVSDCFTDIVTTYGGLTADATTVQDTGIIPQITNFVCDQTDVKERLDKLAEIMNWGYYYRADTDKVYFHPKQFNANATTLTVGSNVVNVPKWKYDKTDLINDLRIDGVFQEDTVEETFSGDAAEDEFTLAVTPVRDIIIYVNPEKDYRTDSPTQSERQTLGVEGATSGAYDFTVDKSKKKTIFETASIPDTGTHNILVRYVGKKEVPVHIVDDVSIDAYKLHQKVIQLKDVITVPDAEIRANNVIEGFKDPFQSAVLNVRHDSSYSFELGDSIPVVDSINTPNVSDTFTIYGITYFYPKGYDEIKVGDREYDPPEFFINVTERLHRLERELISEGTVLTELRRTTMDLTLEPDSLTALIEYINDSFILNHPINSRLSGGDYIILDDCEGGWTDWVATYGGAENDALTGAQEAGVVDVGASALKLGVDASKGTEEWCLWYNNSIETIDLSDCVGVSAGQPKKGKVFIRVAASDVTKIADRAPTNQAFEFWFASSWNVDDMRWYKTKAQVGISVNNTYVTWEIDLSTTNSHAKGSIDWTAITAIGVRIYESVGNAVDFNIYLDDIKITSGFKAEVVDDFEDHTDWSEGSGSETLVIAANSTAGHYWVGSQGVKATWTATSGNGIIESTENYGDLSRYFS